MNISDPLENHRKNLHNFYLACNLLTNPEVSNSNNTEDYEDDVNINENVDPSLLPFFPFEDTSTSGTTGKFCDNNNLAADDSGNRDAENCTSTEVAIDSNEFFQISEDEQADKPSCSMEKSTSLLERNCELDSAHLGLLDADGECASDLSKDSKVEEQKFVSPESIAFKKNENDAISFNLPGNRSSFVLEENSTVVVPQDFEDNENLNSQSEDMTEFSCDHCMKTFRYKSGIIRHASRCPDRTRAKERKQLSSEVIRPKKWKKTALVEKTCKICGHVARKPCELKLHLSKHTGERPFLCRECGIGFSSTSKLNRHIRNKVHAKGKFYCESCKIYFTLEANYERHKSEHSLPMVEMKPFPCPVCSKRFSRVDILRKHADVHCRGERELFECMACERKFSRKDTLSRHINRKKCMKEN